MGKSIFVAGTGTEVGKTYVAALIVKKLSDAGLNVGYYKAALSGAEVCGGRLIPGDAEYVYRTAGLTGDPACAASYIYKEAFSPHLAARVAGEPVEMAKVKEDFNRRLALFDYLVVEGSGGVVCPIRWDGATRIMLEDIIKEFGLRSLIVGDAGLGAINSAVLTANYMKERGIETAGVILNNWEPENLIHADNKKMIEELSGVPVLCETVRGARVLPLSASALAELFR